MSKRILIIDNDPGVLNVMREILEYSGFEVVALPSTPNIFNDIIAFNPHLLLIDYLLNEINGGELCHQVKENPATCYLPVIIVSAYPKVIDSLGYYGCDTFIAKPFDMNDLLDKVDRYSLNIN
ncbi:CheY-like chemotaxis protein [Mucilaginibacter sp. UYP25]|uniref:response regulator n=1 Tax=unclassified Mucilaginibacter TaxID=2617802 RepID=UPI003394C3FA